MKHLYDYLMEHKQITFNSANPNYGQCVILAGGAGSGKGFISNRLLLNARTIDVDKFKEQYIKMQEQGKLKEQDDYKYSMKNPDDVTKLHFKVKERNWKQKQREYFFHALEQNINIDPTVIDNIKRNSMRGSAGSAGSTTGRTNKLPNVIWDMVCGEIEDIEAIIGLAKPMGYQITIVWVVCNKETARTGNEIRDRIVSNETIDKTHDGAYETLNGLLTGKYPDVINNIDNIWIGLSAGYGRKLADEYKSSPVIQVKYGIKNDVKYPGELVDKYLKMQQPYDYDYLNRMYNSSNETDRERCKLFMKIEGLTPEDLKTPGNIKEGDNYDNFNYGAWDEFLESIGMKR